MKKTLMLVLLATNITSMGYAFKNYNFTAENEQGKKPLWPNVTPIYSSYYDDAGEMLYIYGCLSGKNVEMRVQHNGTIVLYDIISPGSLPAQYDCSGWETGSYRVTISADSTIVTTFSFEIS